MPFEKSINQYSLMFENRKYIFYRSPPLVYELVLLVYTKSVFSFRGGSF